MRAWLFDMDGTIVDSLVDIGGSMNAVLAALGHPTHALDDYRAKVGEGARSLVARAMPEGTSEAAIDDALARYKARYRAHLVVETRPYAGVDAVLAALAARGDALGVVTNKPHAAAEEVVARLFAPGRFGVVLGEREGLPRKPDPGPALEAARALGVPPAACVFVGDTGVDIETARRAGMRAVGVTWGLRARAELEAAGADHLIDTPEALLTLPD